MKATTVNEIIFAILDELKDKDTKEIDIEKLKEKIYNGKTEYEKIKEWEYKTR